METKKQVLMYLLMILEITKLGLWRLTPLSTFTILEMNNIIYVNNK
jgi:hypothetical protein